MKRVCCAILLMLPWVGAFAADPGGDALAWLERMRHALQSLTYQGTLIYMHDGRMESMYVVHKNDGNREMERLVQLTGTPREVIRRGDVVTCYLPDRRTVLVGRRQTGSNMLARLATDFSRFQGIYTLSFGGTERVAGRLARAVLVAPKDGFRYGYRLWIDSDSGLLLKSDLLGENGAPLEQFMFANVQVMDQVPDSLLEPTIVSQGFTWFHEEPDAQESADIGLQWQVAKLPEGFMVRDHFRHPMPGSVQPAERIVITDGLATLSVYIEKTDASQQTFTGTSRVGAVNVFGRLFGNHQVMVVGETPQVTVKLVAESVSPSAGIAPRD